MCELGLIKCYNASVTGVRITFIWFTVHEGEVIDGNVASKIIPNCPFNQNLPRRKDFAFKDKEF